MQFSRLLLTEHDCLIIEHEFLTRKLHMKHANHFPGALCTADTGPVLKEHLRWSFNAGGLKDRLHCINRHIHRYNIKIIFLFSILFTQSANSAVSQFLFI